MKRQKKKSRRSNKTRPSRSLGKSGSGSASPPRKSKPTSEQSKPVAEPIATSKLVSKPVWVTLASVFGLIFIWSYWPILGNLVDQWNRVPDYSHGFLVIPLTAFFLWNTKESFPSLSPRISWMGMTLILVAGLMRIAGSYYFLEALHGWSIPVWLAGFVWTFFGWDVFKWSVPAIAFLVFMVPIPYSVEHMLSQPLQQISTKISMFTLQCLGQPAVAEGTTIVLGEHTLEVERACSGLRIFFGIAALAYAFILLFKRPLWTKLILVMAILPIAILSNSLRIVATGLAYQMGMSETASELAHDAAGLVMIPIAAGFFALTLYYLDRLFPAVQSVASESLVRSQSKRMVKA